MVSAEERPIVTPEDAVNTYLVEHHQVSLEEVISEGVEGRPRAALAATVQVEARRIDHWRDEEGAVAELYEGLLTLEGVRYAWRATRSA